MKTLRRTAMVLIVPALAWLGAACEMPTEAPSEPLPPATSVEVTAAAHGSHGPDAFGYTAFSIPFTFRDISTTGTTVLNAADDAFVSFPIGFTFSFYGLPYTTVFVSTNGVLTFGAGNDNFENQAFTGRVDPDVPTIAPLWDDWRTDCSELFPICTEDDRVVVETVGEPGKRLFIVQWHVVPHYETSPSTVTFQAVLFEETNAIEFRYLDTDTGDANASGASATVGIRDVGGHSNGRFIEWSYNQAVIPNETAILVSPSGKVTGGGQIDVTSPNGKGSFGFNAKRENGAASGHLNYMNHATPRAYLDCTVKAVKFPTATTAKFSGPCSSKSAASSFEAEVEDNGKSGKDDKFTITYGGNSDGVGTIRSGNIQIHQ